MVTAAESHHFDEILNEALERRAVDSIFASNIRGTDPDLTLASMSRRGGDTLSDVQALFLLSMVASTNERFACDVKGARFLAMRRGAFVVGATGPRLRDHGLGLQNAVANTLNILNGVSA